MRREFQLAWAAPFVLASIVLPACQGGTTSTRPPTPRLDSGGLGIRFDAGAEEADGGETSDLGSSPGADATPRADVDPSADADPTADAVSGGDAASAGDGGSADAAPGADAIVQGDTGGPSSDAGASARCEIRFRLDDAAATSVWVTGSFVTPAWAPTPAQGAIAMTKSGNEWSATVAIDPPGRHLYKFIVDGNRWIQDPANAERESDGFGGYNSVLHACEGGFRVTSHATNGAARTFTATLEYDGAADPATATLTLDLDPAQGALTVQGRRLMIDISALTDGIHDVRVAVGPDEILLKVYVGESTDWRDTAMYFVLTDRFANGNNGNDSPIGGIDPRADYMGGDFAGITQKIQGGYFDDLGISALWISWPLDSSDRAWPGRYKTASGCNITGEATQSFSGYHGYWPTSGRDVDRRFGTLDELKLMVREAHRHGIRVLLDLPANHVHEESPYYSMNGSWFNQPAILCRDGHWDDNQRETCWFDSFLPDWNYSNAAARKQVLDDTMWLVHQVGADGLRVDALKHMAGAFITDLRARTVRELEHTGIPFYLVGETFTGDTGLINQYVNDRMMHGQFDFPANQSILQGFATNEIGLDEMHRRVRSIKGQYGMSLGLMSSFAGNHDIARFVTKAAGDLGSCGAWSVAQDQARAWSNPPSQPSDETPYRRLRLALGYVFTLPGIPLLYYGDEVGLAGAGDPDNRRMLPEDGALNAHQRATRQLVQTLAQARAGNAVLRTGSWTDALWADGDVLVFGRSSQSAKALIVLNRGGSRSIDVTVSGFGLSDGAVLRPLIGQGNVTVAGGRAGISTGGLSLEIYVSP